MCSLRLAYCLFTFFVLCGGCCDSRCLPQTPFSLFPHSSSHNLPHTKDTSLHSFPRDFCQELLGFFFRRRCNTPQKHQNLLSLISAEPSAMGSSSSTYLSHPLLRHSHLWPHFSLCNNTYDTYIETLTQRSDSPSCDTIIRCFIPAELIFVIQCCWCCLSREECPFSQGGMLLLVYLHIYGGFVTDWDCDWCSEWCWAPDNDQNAESLLKLLLPGPFQTVLICASPNLSLIGQL